MEIIRRFGSRKHECRSTTIRTRRYENEFPSNHTTKSRDYYSVNGRTKLVASSTIQ